MRLWSNHLFYGQASCGDDVCDLSESCSTCSADCGTCPSGGRAIDKGYIEEIKSWIEITPELGAVISNFDEDFGISEIRLKVSGETRNARITFRKYHSKPEEIFVEAPGIVYKYLQIEAQNLETLEEATLKIRVMRTWASENNVDN
ncbi:MAG: hypothetical protein IID33_05465, partial [Planctomycetes bacterium]|nr:hypothetical protein [Planctomycetota bacterium]